MAMDLPVEIPVFAAHVGTPADNVKMYPFVPAARKVVVPDDD